MINTTGHSPDPANNLMSTSTDEFVETPFNAGPFIESLRSSGYDVYTATADLVDNCVDAGATKVWIDVEPSIVKKPDGGTKKVIDIESCYYIADNGCGMNEETLLQAMAVGSNTDHDATIDLGKFGVGLKQACLGLAKAFTVITKEKDGPFLRSTFSCDQIIAEGKLGVTKPSLASEKEIAFFEHKTKDSPSGTIVILSHLDRFGISDPNSFKSTLKGSHQLGRTFRFMLAGNLQIFVGRARKGQDAKVMPADPIKWDSKETTPYTDGWVKMNVVGAQKKGTISYRIAKWNPQSNSVNHFASTRNTGGVIWVRNQREIKAGIEKRLFTSSNDTYGLYVEIKFTGDLLDDAINLTTRKDNVKPGQDLMDKLCEVLRPQIKTIRSKEREKNKERSKTSNNVKESLKDFCEDVKKIENLLDLPPIASSAVGFDKSGTTKNNSSSKANGKSNSATPKISGNGEISFQARGKREFEFELHPGRKLGFLYEAEQEGNVIRVIANEDHDFISKNLIGTSEESVQGAVKRMLYALALAELLVPDEYRQAFDDFKDRFNKSLRVVTTEI